MRGISPKYFSTLGVTPRVGQSCHFDVEVPSAFVPTVVYCAPVARVESGPAKASGITARNTFHETIALLSQPRRHCCRQSPRNEAFWRGRPLSGQAQKPASKSYLLKAERMLDGKSNALARPGLVVVTTAKLQAWAPQQRHPQAPKLSTSETRRCYQDLSTRTPTSP